MIVDTREQFVNNISDLVERDIINNHTIENELGKIEFQRVFYNMMSDMLKSHIYKNTENVDFIRIPGMRDSLNNFFEFYKSHMSELTGNFINSVFSNIYLEDVIGTHQRQHVADKIYGLCVTELDNSNILESVLANLYKENQQKQIDELIHPKIIKTVATNVSDISENLHERLQTDFSKQIDRTIATMYTHLNISGILKEFEKSLKDKTFIEIFGTQHAQGIANEILGRAVKLLKSAEGKKLIDGFSISVFKTLKSINVSIFSIMNEAMSTRLEQYMRNELPAVVERVIRWIKVNREDIDSLINQSVDDVLADESDGWFNFRGKAKKALKNAFYENISGQFELVRYIIDYVERGTDIRTMSQDVTNALLSYMKRNTIAQIITDLESKKILHPDFLTALINNNIDNHIAKLNISMFDPLFQNKVGTIITVDFAKYMEDYIKNILNTELKNKFLFSEKGSKIVQRELKNKIAGLAEEKLGNVVGTDRADTLTTELNSRILRDVKKHRAKLVSMMSNGINEAIGSKKISDFLDESMRQKIGKIIADRSLYYLRDKIDDAKQHSLTELYDKLNAQKDIVKNITGLSLQLVNDNLHFLLEGKIRQAVHNNLSKLPDQEIQTMVENFMGRELQPINLFGAILGGATGFLFYLGQSHFKFTESQAAELLSTVAVYSFVGYITNVIALKMIFRPYNALSIGGMSMPFTPGVVAKQKPRFAVSMGEFVGQNLLHAEGSKQVFLEKRSTMEKGFIEGLSQDDYKLLHSLLTDNIDLIAEKTLTFAMKFIDKNRTLFVDHLTEEIKESNLSKFDYDTLRQRIVDQSRDYVKRSDYLLTEQVEKILRSQETLGSQLPPSVKESIYVSIDGIIEEKLQVLSELINDDRQMDKVLDNFSKSFDKIIDKNIHELLSSQQTTKLQDTISSHFLARVKDLETRKSLTKWVEEKFAKEVTPTKRVGDLFNGVLIQIFHQNADFILDSIIGAAQKKVQSNRGAIKREVYSTFRSSQGVGGKLADFALNIEDSIYSVIDDLVDYKLPYFIDRKHYELKTILTEFIDGKVAKTRIGDLGIEMNSQGVAGMVDRVLDSSGTGTVLKTLSDDIVLSVIKTPMKSLLKMASVNTIFDVYHVFEREIKQLRTGLSDSLETNQAIVVRDAGELVQTIIEKYYLNLPITSFTNGIGQEEVSKSVKQLVEVISDSKSFNNSLDGYVKAITGEIRYKEVHELVNIDLLKKDILVTFEKLLQDEQAKKNLTIELGVMLKVMIGNLNSIVTADTKNFILIVTVKSMLDALEGHVEHIIAAINVQQVTEREINNMNPREIEEMFNSFASPYFRRIEAYGALGGGFGLIAGLMGRVIGL